MKQTKDIWNLYNNDIKQFILSQVKAVDVAEDLLQDTFLKVHTKRQQLKDETKLKSWLFSIAHHMVTDYFRNQHDVKITDKQLLVKPEEQPEHTEQDCLQGIIKNLPDKYRKPLFLYDVKGLKQKKIAEVLHLPLPTIKSQIQRARKLVTQGFVDCCDYKLNDKGYLVGELKEKKDCKVCR